MGTQQRERLHLIGAGVLALVIALVGWFLLISPQRDETADIQSQTADAQLTNTTLQSRVTQLSGEQAKAGQYRAALAAARTALPSSTGASAFLRQLQSLAATTRTAVTSVNVGDPTPVSAAPAPATAPSATASSASPSANTPAAGQAGGSASGILQLPLTATVSGRDVALSRFLGRLQDASNTRAVLLTSVTRAKGTGGTSSLQLSMTAFVAPASGGAATTPTPGGR